MYIAPFGQHSISSTVYGIYFFRFVCCVEQPFELVSYCYIDCTLPITCLNSIHLFLMRCICTLSHYRNTLPLALTLLRSIECYQYLLGLWVEHYECSAFLGHFAWANHILAIFQHTSNKSLKKNRNLAVVESNQAWISNHLHDTFGNKVIFMWRSGDFQLRGSSFSSLFVFGCQSPVSFPRAPPNSGHLDIGKRWYWCFCDSIKCRAKISLSFASIAGTRTRVPPNQLINFLFDAVDLYAHVVHINCFHWMPNVLL